MAGDLDGPYLAKWAAMGAGFIALVMLFLRFWRRGMADQVVPYMEWRRLMQPGANDVYDEHAQRLAALAKERGEQISLKAPLPENSSGIVLMCKVEYSVMGERRTSAGRAPLSNRLDPAGIERLIFHPAERKTIELFVGLPDEARIDAQGQWSSVPVLGPSVQLALTGATAAVAFAAFCWHVLAHIEMFR